MIKLIFKIVSVVLLLALAIIAFIKLLPWCLAIVALLALAKFCHTWLCRQGIISAGCWHWPAKPDNGPQNAA